MKSIAVFSVYKALLIASAWPMLLLLAVAVVYAAFGLTLRDEASRAGPSASADIVVSITSWPLAIAILFVHRVCFSESGQWYESLGRTPTLMGNTVVEMRGWHSGAYPSRLR